MILRITNDADDTDCLIDEIRLSPTQFNSKSFFPFMYTHDWVMIIIDVSNDIKKGIVSELINKHKVVPYMPAKTSVSWHMLSILCEMAKDHSAYLRKAYMEGQDSLRNELLRIMDIYAWSSSLKVKAYTDTYFTTEKSNDNAEQLS